MGSIFLTVKAMLFLVMGFIVVGTIGIAVMAGLYQVARDSIRRRGWTSADRPHLPTRAG